MALLAPDFLKIDMALVRDLHASATKTHLVRRIVQFANDMGIGVVAEGIESPQEAELATELGVTIL